jgi:4-amino-4-deoxy-L-arabinose transferase-like glycosyltransferase
MVALYWFLGLVIDRRPAYWIYLGITLGIGLEVKYTVAGLIVGIGIAVLLTPSLRMDLRTRYPWIASAIALLIWAPNLAWQVVEGFPSLTYITNHGGGSSGPVDYLIQFGVYFFFLIPLWLAGMVSFFRGRLRAIGLVYACDCTRADATCFRSSARRASRASSWFRRRRRFPRHRTCRSTRWPRWDARC